MAKTLTPKKDVPFVKSMFLPSAFSVKIVLGYAAAYKRVPLASIDVKDVFLN